MPPLNRQQYRHYRHDMDQNAGFPSPSPVPSPSSSSLPALSLTSGTVLPRTSTTMTTPASYSPPPPPPTSQPMRVSPPPYGTSSNGNVVTPPSSSSSSSSSMMDISPTVSPSVGSVSSNNNNNTSILVEGRARRTPSLRGGSGGGVGATFPPIPNLSYHQQSPQSPKGLPNKQWQYNHPQSIPYRPAFASAATVAPTCVFGGSPSPSKENYSPPTTMSVAVTSISTPETNSCLHKQQQQQQQRRRRSVTFTKDDDDNLDQHRPPQQDVHEIPNRDQWDENDRSHRWYTKADLLSFRRDIIHTVYLIQNHPDQVDVEDDDDDCQNDSMMMRIMMSSSSSSSTPFHNNSLDVPASPSSSSPTGTSSRGAECRVPHNLVRRQNVRREACKQVLLVQQHARAMQKKKQHHHQYQMQQSDYDRQGTNSPTSSEHHWNNNCYMTVQGNNNIHYKTIHDFDEKETLSLKIARSYSTTSQMATRVALTFGQIDRMAADQIYFGRCGRSRSH